MSDAERPEVIRGVLPDGEPELEADEDYGPDEPGEMTYPSTGDEPETEPDEDDPVGEDAGGAPEPD
jgi:hypothetical protein